MRAPRRPRWRRPGGGNARRRRSTGRRCRCPRSRSPRGSPAADASTPRFARCTGAPRATSAGRGGECAPPGQCDRIALAIRTRTTGGHPMDLGLQGKRAIVTGGSLGIGKAVARELAREGVDVAIVARTKDQLEATAKELAAETGRRIIPLAADVTNRAQVDAMVAQAATELDS